MQYLPWVELAGEVSPGATLQELSAGKSAGNWNYFHLLLIICEQHWQMMTMGASEAPDYCVCTNSK